MAYRHQRDWETRLSTAPAEGGLSDFVEVAWLPSLVPRYGKVSVGTLELAAEEIAPVASPKRDLLKFVGAHELSEFSELSDLQ